MSSASSQVMAKPYELGSNWELVNKIQHEWRVAFNAYQTQFARCERNWKAYTGMEGGAWEDKDRDVLSREDRIASVFNVTRPKVDSFTGAQLSEAWDFDWVPAEGPRGPVTDAIKDSYYIDKDMMDYESHTSNCLRDGNVFAGEEKMELSQEHGGLPRIKFVCKQAPFVLRDPYWISNDDADCESLWDVYHLSPVQIWNVFHPKGSIIQNALRQYKFAGGDWREEEQIFSQVERELKGHMLRVIEHHWLDTIHTTRAIGRVRNDSRWVPFPMTDDTNKLTAFRNVNDIDPTTIFEIPVKQRIHRVSTICPSLLSDALLEEGISRVQCGRLPYFQYSTARVNGYNMGVVDFMFYAQQHIDKRESKLTDLIETSQGGGKMVNADAFRDPKDVRQFIDHGNDPSAIFMMNGDEMRQGQLVQYINQNQYPAQIINQLERMYTVIDTLTSVPIAQQAQTQSANEPAALYDRKLQVARIATQLSTNRVRQHQKNKAEAYFFQWQRSYSGARREYSSRDGKRHVVLNERILQNGKIMLKNVPMLAPRCSVFVTESEKSLNRMTSNRLLYEGLINKVAATHPELATLMLHGYLKTMPLDDDMKGRLKRIETLQSVRDMAKIKADVASFDAVTAQSIMTMVEAAMSTEQMQSQAQQQGGGASAEGLPGEAVPQEEVEGRLAVAQ